MVGNLMTASYCSGLTLGSLLAYWLDSLLGPPNSNPCPAQMATLSPPTHRSQFLLSDLLSLSTLLQVFGEQSNNLMSRGGQNFLILHGYSIQKSFLGK